MKNFRSVWVVFVLVGVFLFFMGTGLSSAEVGVTDTTIKIGNIQDTTGLIAGYGIPRVEAVKTLIKHYNDEGGINGRKIILVHESDDYKPSKTVVAFKKLVEVDKVFCFSATLGISNVMALLPEIDRKKIPFLFIGGTSTALYYPPRRYILGIWATYSHYQQTLLNYVARDLKMPNAKIAFIHQESESGRDSKRGFYKGVAKYPGMKVVEDIEFKRTTIDYSGIIYRARKANPDIVQLATIFPQTAAMAREMNKVGWKPIVLADSSSCDGALMKLGGSAVEGTILLNTRAMLFEDLPGVNQYKKLTKKYYPNSKLNPSSYGASGWVEMLITLEAIKRAGRNLTREGLINTLESFRNVEFGGWVPPVTFGPDKHLGNDKTKIIQVKGGKFVKLAEWRGPE